MFLIKETENTDYLSKYLDIPHNDRIHEIILRLKTDNTFFFIKCLNSCTVFNQCNHHLSNRSGILLFHKNHIPIQNTCIDHAFPTYRQKKGLIIRKHIYRKWEIIFNILLCK